MSVDFVILLRQISGSVCILKFWAGYNSFVKKKKL